VRVLIVDDSMVMRKILELALRQSGLDMEFVLQAANGVEALAVLERAAQENAPLDLILCDVHMPVMDGLNFLLERRRRTLGPAVPVVMITAESSDPEVLKAMAAGAQGFIAKPFTLAQMQASLAFLQPCAA
jgi:two-component system, chemotaxis family, chemotaxis protein CheY